MEVIVGHSGTDFDCLAATVAAKKLHPRAVCVLPGRVDRNVREFLSLYEDQFDLHMASELDLSQVERVIMVDTRRPHRLGRALAEVVQGDGVEVIIYDHHPPSEGDIEGAELHWDSVGATTTILTREIRDREIPLTPVEATTLALGIYEDTGSLAFSSTSVEDVLCVAFLLQSGANLDVVSRYIRYSLTEEQREVLNQFLLSVEHITAKGVKVAFAEAKVAEYVVDIAVLTNRLAVIESVDALFTLTAIGSHVYLVGRSRSDALNVADVLEHIGGGGHHRAAAAVVRDRSLEEVRQELVQRIEECVRPPLTARDLMSYPVRMVTPATSVADAKRVLLRYGYSGVLVGEEGRVVGTVTRKELDRAIHHGLGHAPVKSCMTQRVPSATPDTPAPEIQDLLISHRVGRVAILDETGRVVGVVTRADLRRGTRRPSESEHRVYQGELGGVEDVSAILRARTHDGLTELLTRIGCSADSLGVPVFLVGGAARDLLLGAESVDVDVLVEGDAISFGQSLAGEFGARLTTHEKFGTATLALPDGRKIDIASARTEFYEAPGALPTVEVEHSSVKDDLYRRDFTINAMAVQINAQHFGRLLDFFGGRADLERGVIRVMHSLSFVEDPTRIFRAVRFEQRLNFRIEEQTEALIGYALESDLFAALTGERIRDEIVAILSEHDPIPAVHRLSHLGVWEHVHEKMTFDNPALDELRRTTEVIEWLGQLEPPIATRPWLAYLCALLRHMTPTDVRDLARRLRLTREDTDQLSVAAESLEFVLPTLESSVEIRPSSVYQILAPQPALVLARLLVCAEPGGHAEERVRAYLTDLRNRSLSVGGDDLQRLGYPPGPAYGRILRRLFAELLDGEIVPGDELRRLAEIAREVSDAAARAS